MAVWGSFTQNVLGESRFGVEFPTPANTEAYCAILAIIPEYSLVFHSVSISNDNSVVDFKNRLQARHYIIMYETNSKITKSSGLRTAWSLPEKVLVHTGALTAE